MHLRGWNLNVTFYAYSWVKLKRVCCFGVLTYFCSPRVSFCGYSIPHPSDARVNIRVQTTGKAYILFFTWEFGFCSGCSYHFILNWIFHTLVFFHVLIMLIFSSNLDRLNSLFTSVRWDLRWIWLLAVVVVNIFSLYQSLHLPSFFIIFKMTGPISIELGKNVCWVREYLRSITYIKECFGSDPCIDNPLFSLDSILWLHNFPSNVRKPFQKNKWFGAIQRW